LNADRAPQSEGQRSALVRDNPMHTVIVTLFHPGDLSLGQWAGLFGMFVAFIILPIAVIGFIIFKIMSRHSGGGVGGESHESITLRLNDPKGK
jgi:hypothetical protein